jgi:hypothetical protein
MLDPIPTPAWLGASLRYKTHARPKRTFNTVLDAGELLVDGSISEVSLEREADIVMLGVITPLRSGQIVDRIELDPGAAGSGLSMRRLDRRVLDASGNLSRQEVADFNSSTHALPACTYVEVGLPFLLGAQPFDGKVRSLYAWICDRFVAKVYYESRGLETLKTASGSVEVREVLMYPDLNDWVKMPGILNKLAKPFLPKYHMWYEAKAPHRLVRFEGPYGPPGAPEIVLELA